jgi:hypothetical protein
VCCKERFLKQITARYSSAEMEQLLKEEPRQRIRRPLRAKQRQVLTESRLSGQLIEEAEAIISNLNQATRNSVATLHSNAQPRSSTLNRLLPQINPSQKPRYGADSVKTSKPGKLKKEASASSLFNQNKAFARAEFLKFSNHVRRESSKASPFDNQIKFLSNVIQNAPVPPPVPSAKPRAHSKLESSPQPALYPQVSKRKQSAFY